LGGARRTSEAEREERVQEEGASAPTTDASANNRRSLGPLTSLARSLRSHARRFDKIRITLREEYNMPKDVASHLVSNYGTRALQVAELCKPGGPTSDKQVAATKYGHKRLVARYVRALRRAVCGGSGQAGGCRGGHPARRILRTRPSPN
jgi:hypothetical protein